MVIASKKHTFVHTLHTSELTTPMVIYQFKMIFLVADPMDKCMYVSLLTISQNMKEDTSIFRK